MLTDIDWAHSGAALLLIIVALQIYADLAGRRIIRRFIADVEGPPMFATHLVGEAREAYGQGSRARMRWLKLMQAGMDQEMGYTARRIILADRVTLFALILLAFYYAVTMFP